MLIIIIIATPLFKMATNTEVDENEDREEELLLHVSQEDEQEERSLLEGVERKGDLKGDIAVEEKEIDISSVKYPSHPVAAAPPPPLSTRIKKYVYNGGNFITGIDTTSEESLEKKANRQERFGIEVSQAPSEAKLNQRAKRFGTSVVATSNGEIIRFVAKLPEVSEGGEEREEGVVIHGTDEMSTGQVLKLFSEYGPSHLEWINDSSCVVVWEDPASAHRAFLGKGVWPLLEEKWRDESEGRDPIWRKGPGELLMRKATTLDIKKKGAAQKSEYYRKYGKLQSGKVEKRKRKRNNNNVDLRQRIEERRENSDTEEMDTNELKYMKLQKEEGEEETEGMEVDDTTTPATLVSDKITTTAGPNDLRNKLSSAKKREELKSRLGPFPLM